MALRAVYGTDTEGASSTHTERVSRDGSIDNGKVHVSSPEDGPHVSGTGSGYSHYHIGASGEEHSYDTSSSESVEADAYIVSCTGEVYSE